MASTIASTTSVSMPAETSLLNLLSNAARILADVEEDAERAEKNLTVAGNKIRMGVLWSQ
jgi:hypothetical protein